MMISWGDTPCRKERRLRVRRIAQTQASECLLESNSSSIEHR